MLLWEIAFINKRKIFRFSIEIRDFYLTPPFSSLLHILCREIRPTCFLTAPISGARSHDPEIKRRNNDDRYLVRRPARRSHESPIERWRGQRWYAVDSAASPKREGASRYVLPVVRFFLMPLSTECFGTRRARDFHRENDRRTSVCTASRERPSVPLLSALLSSLNCAQYFTVASTPLSSFRLVTLLELPGTRPIHLTPRHHLFRYPAYLRVYARHAQSWDGIPPISPESSVSVPLPGVRQAARVEKREKRDARFRHVDANYLAWRELAATCRLRSERRSLRGCNDARARWTEHGAHGRANWFLARRSSRIDGCDLSPREIDPSECPGDQ